MEFMVEFEQLADEVQDELLSQLQLLERRGPALGRPRVDTLNGSKHSNMKSCVSAPMAVFGESRSRSTRHVVRFCWLRVIKPASVSIGFTEA
jgi:hypothetical protein